MKKFSRQGKSVSRYQFENSGVILTLHGETVTYENVRLSFRAQQCHLFNLKVTSVTQVRIRRSNV